MSGCDGWMKIRTYYEEFAKDLPKYMVILPSGCAKYRYVKLSLGDILGTLGCWKQDSATPVIHGGRGNEVAEIFQANDINDLPIVFYIAGDELMAVIVQLAILSLGIKNIHIYPTLPVFVSPNVLVEKFGLGGISIMEEDLKKMM